MNPNPYSWQRVLDRLTPVGFPLEATRPPAAGVPIPVTAPCPPGVRVPLRALLREAFLRGNLEAPLVDALADVEGWTRDAPEPPRARVAIVIPVRGAHRALRLCLECIDQHTDGDQHDAVVCTVTQEAELGAVRRAAEGLCSCLRHATLTRQRPQSFAENVNVGASATNSEFLVLLNSDAYVGPGWLGRLLEPFDDPEVVAVGPMGTNVSGHQAVDLLPVHGRTLPDRVVTPADVARCTRGLDGDAAWSSPAPDGEPYAARRLVGFCIAVRRSAWDRIGGMDERFENAYCDDDLTLRLSLVGTCVVVPKLLVLHEGQASFAEMLDPQHEYGRALHDNAARFADKWRWILREWNAWCDARGWR